MRFRVMGCWLFRAVFRTSTFFAICFPSLPFLSYSILLLQRMDSSLPFPQTHLPNTNRLNGWGVMLRDTLDTMYAIGLYDDFEDAIGFVGNLTFLCRPYVLPTFSLCPSSHFTSPFSHLRLSFSLHLPTSLPLTSYTSLTSTHAPSSPANLLRTLLQNNHPLPWRPPLSTRTLLPKPPLKS